MLPLVQLADRSAFASSGTTSATLPLVVFSLIGWVSDASFDH